jgi:hypothetical protein
MVVTQRGSTDTFILNSQEYGYAYLAHPSASSSGVWFHLGAGLDHATRVFLEWRVPRALCFAGATIMGSCEDMKDERAALTGSRRS